MWDYFRSRLIEMPQVFLGMDFIQAFNPLYALPIVAVILGAFLVYAFGFKAPVQPPSFDEIEIDKKTSKRKRVKENQKNKIAKASSNNKPTDNLIVDKKKKNDKSAVEKASFKDEIKSMKKSALTTEKKKVNTGQEQSLVIEDDSDEGWVHLVSKKGRKGRKKDDSSPSSETIHSTVIQAEVVLEFCDKPLENEVATDVLDEKKETNKCGNDVKIQQKALLKEEQVIKVTNKKQKSKKKDKENIEVAPNPCSTLDQETIIESKNPVMADVNNSDVSSSAGMKVAKEKKPSKKKKKKYEVDEKENIQTTEAPSVVPYSLCASEKNIPGLPAVTSEKKGDRVPEVEVVASVKKTNVVEKSDVTSNMPEQPIEAKGLNVAFDELEGLYPDSKPVKKKKKVRRDH